MASPSTKKPRAKDLELPQGRNAVAVEVIVVVVRRRGRTGRSPQQPSDTYSHPASPDSVCRSTDCRCIAGYRYSNTQLKCIRWLLISWALHNSLCFFSLDHLPDFAVDCSFDCGFLKGHPWSSTPIALFLSSCPLSVSLHLYENIGNHLLTVRKVFLLEELSKCF